MTSLPKQILEASTPQLFFMSMMGPEFVFMTSKFIEIYVAVMKEGRVSTFEELIAETIEKMEEVEENHPFFD